MSDANRTGATVVNALSIDLEDWFHAELVRPRVQEDWPERRVEWAVEPLLFLLEQHDVRATFFIVGDVLRHHPDLVRRIYAQGHEIGCHGWSHRPLWSIDRERFAWELEEFDRDAEGVIPVEEVVGFRAPTFSLDERTGWALDVLRQRGYRYDSSIFPMRTHLYGLADAPDDPYRPTADELTTDHAEGDLVELPMTVYRAGEFKIPISGGFYMRAMPWGVWRYLLQKMNEQGRFFVTYLHPWEADRCTPRVRGLSPLNWLATYYNLRSTLAKLEALLQTFCFAPLREVLGVPQQRAGEEVGA